MSLAFAQYLEDFGSSSGLSQLTMVPEISNGDVAPAVEMSVDLESEKAISYQEGYSAASQALSDEHAAQLELLAQSHKEELAKKEDEVYTQISQELMSGLAFNLDQVSQNIKSEVSVILMKVLEEDLVQRSIEQLDEIIKKTLKENPNSKIDISGPNILLEKIKDHLGKEVGHVNLTEANDADLTVEVDRSILKTRLVEWQQNFGDELP